MYLDFAKHYNTQKYKTVFPFQLIKTNTNNVRFY